LGPRLLEFGVRFWIRFFRAVAPNDLGGIKSDAKSDAKSDDEIGRKIGRRIGPHLGHPKAPLRTRRWDTARSSNRAPIQEPQPPAHWTAIRPATCPRESPRKSDRESVLVARACDHCSIMSTHEFKVGCCTTEGRFQYYKGTTMSPHGFQVGFGNC